MLKKIFWTVILILLSIGAITAFSFGLMDAQWDELNTWFLFMGWIILSFLPMWFAWKGTKLIPIVTILPIRIVLMIVGLFISPLLLFFALWGVWVKS